MRVMRRFPATACSLAVLALAGATVGCASTGGSEGQKKTAALTASTSDLADTLRGAKQDLSATLSAHDAVVSAQGDLVKSYKEFEKHLARCEKTTAKVDKELEAVRTAAQANAAQWEADISKITDESLQKKSRDQLEHMRKAAGGIQELVAKARESMASVMQKLRDHQTYLSANLSQTSATSLAKDSKDLKEDADDVLGAMDKAIGAAEKYAQEAAMRIPPPPPEAKPAG